MKNKLLYSILFLKGKNGATINELKTLLSVSDTEIRKIIKSLKKDLKILEWPIVLKENEFKIRLVVSRDISHELSKVMDKTINVSLSQSLIETLTIIAYKQPVTKATIEHIRSVSADYAITKLMDYGLIESNGNANLPGNPRLFETTQEFLDLFDFETIEDLPVAPEEFEQKTQETTLSLFEYDSIKEDKNDKEQKQENDEEQENNINENDDFVDESEFKLVDGDGEEIK